MADLDEESDKLANITLITTQEDRNGQQDYFEVLFIPIYLITESATFVFPTYSTKTM